jgi:hypothetical protein
VIDFHGVRKEGILESDPETKNKNVFLLVKTASLE